MKAVYDPAFRVYRVIGGDDFVAIRGQYSFESHEALMHTLELNGLKLNGNNIVADEKTERGATGGRLL